MKQKQYQVAFSAALVVVMVVFLSTVFFANASCSFAAEAKEKSTTVTETTAVEYAEYQIKQLRDTLDITEAQENLWNNFILAMRENAKDMDAFTKERAERTRTANAVEHMKYHRQITEAHLNQMNKFLPPFEAFYGGMSDEQKKIIDNTFRTGKYEKRKHKRN